MGEVAVELITTMPKTEPESSMAPMIEPLLLFIGKERERERGLLTPVTLVEPATVD